MSTLLENQGQALPPHSMDLEALTIAALYFSPELDEARSRVAEANATIVTARVKPNVSVPVTSDSNFQYGKSTPLFQTPIPVRLSWTLGPDYPYDVSPDGQRFLISAPADLRNSTPSFAVIVNWPSALKR